MTAYADYNYYTTTYLAGKSAAVTAADFPYYAKQASAVIDRYTHGNINAESVPDAVRECCCELAEITCKSDSSNASKKEGIASESVQGWSQSYESAESRRNALRSSQKECIYKWLSNTGLLYSGVI